MDNRPVLVAGASGFIGSHLVPKLLEAGVAVRALTRTPSRYHAPPGVQVAQGDVLGRASLDRALHGCRAAYYLVHSMETKEFVERDRQAAAHFRDAAAQAALDHVIYLGGLGAREDTGLSEHLRSRQEVGEILQSGPVPTTVFRAAIILGAGGASFEMLRQLVMRLPAMITPRWVESRCQPIALSNVIAYLTRALADPPGETGTYDIGGPDVLTYRQMMTGFARILGKRPPLIVGVPVLTPRLSSYWVDLVTDVDHRVAQALVEGLRNDVLCEDDAARRRWPLPLLPYREAVMEAMRAEPEEVRRKAGLTSRRGTPRSAP